MDIYCRSQSSSQAFCCKLRLVTRKHSSVSISESGRRWEGGGRKMRGRRQGTFSKFPITCELWIGRPAPVPVFSRVGRDEMNQIKVDLLVTFCWEYQCLIRSRGQKYSYNDSIRSRYLSQISQRSTNQPQHNPSKCQFQGRG